MLWASPSFCDSINSVYALCFTLIFFVVFCLFDLLLLGVLWGFFFGYLFVFPQTLNEGHSVKDDTAN